MTTSIEQRSSSQPGGAQQTRLTNAEVFFLVALASWAMLFGTLILAFVFARIKTPIWPPPELKAFPLFLPLLSTAILLLSSISLAKGIKCYERESLGDFRFFWGMSALLGVAFGVFQYLALRDWLGGGLDVRTHVYASSVFFLIIFHATHVALGLSGLIWKLISPGSQQSLRLWSWFWHFLDVVWIGIFVAIAL